MGPVERSNDSGRYLPESQIEDVFALYPDLLRSVIGYDSELVIIARQKAVESGRIDLLAAAGSNLVLIELKVGPFEKDFLEQIDRYRQDLVVEQQAGRLVAGPVDPFLLCATALPRESELCARRGVKLLLYSPEKVLEEFHRRFATSAAFIRLRPVDHGVWNLGLINRAVYSLEDAESNPAELCRDGSWSPKTAANCLRLARDLNLVEKSKGGRYHLTNLGQRYLKARDCTAPVDYISPHQKHVLRDYIVCNPFASGVVFGIFKMAEAVFELSRNSHPVPAELLSDYFKKGAGKFYEWATKKAEMHGLRMYSNYACDLGLLATVGVNYYVTPDGIRSTLLLSLHKSVKFLDALRLYDN